MCIYIKYTLNSFIKVMRSRLPKVEVRAVKKPKERNVGGGAFG